MRDELASPDLHEQVVRLPDRLELRLRPGQIPELRQEPVLRDESPHGRACISARVDADGDDSDVAPLAALASTPAAPGSGSTRAADRHPDNACRGGRRPAVSAISST